MSTSRNVYLVKNKLTFDKPKQQQLSSPFDIHRYPIALSIGDFLFGINPSAFANLAAELPAIEQYTHNQGGTVIRPELPPTHNNSDIEWAGGWNSERRRIAPPTKAKHDESTTDEEDGDHDGSTLKNRRANGKGKTKSTSNKQNSDKVKNSYFFNFWNVIVDFLPLGSRLRKYYLLLFCK